MSVISPSILFQEVIRCARKERKTIQKILDSTKYMDFAARCSIALVIERSLLTSYPKLDAAETRRFAEIITGVADRVNQQRSTSASTLLGDEINSFRNSRRSVVLDETYDLHFETKNQLEKLYTDWIKDGMPDDRDVQQKFNWTRSMARALTEVPDLIKKDIERNQRTEGEKESGDYHAESLSILRTKITANDD